MTSGDPSFLFLGGFLIFLWVFYFSIGAFSVLDSSVLGDFRWPPLSQLSLVFFFWWISYFWWISCVLFFWFWWVSCLLLFLVDFPFQLERAGGMSGVEIEIGWRVGNMR